ncbi:maleylpyruvate isomerase family mycothiol-dependent enzyme [Nocardioides speluncae]|uniref:maleylpyruvate isomerase family mycothiol-dependent enzyme n=1 Tax=Nocardioides speluncae TaxID=2670337 RepID=UPI00197FD15E|nr:maleylpyruvate isomerase family mycothiol-dependent enzyme [Nocardioides speluncae]
MTDTDNPPATTTFRSGFDRPLAMELAAAEYGLFADTLDALDGAEWSLPTSCPEWTVRDMAGHCLGMVQMAASVPEMIRQQVAANRTARKSGRLMIDELTALQVRKNANLSHAEVTSTYRRLAPKAVAGRRRTPGFVRSRTVTDPGPGGTAPEVWEMGFMFDTILTRDPWMHRSDIALATGQPMLLSAEHDGILVADVVAEWSGRHGQPFDLTLTGPAGGHWSSGDGGEVIEADAVEFCRVLSGRGSVEGLPGVWVPF